MVTQHSTIVQYTQHGDIDQFQVTTTAIPQITAQQVLVRVQFAGLNPVDWKMVARGSGPVEGGAKLTGIDFSGIVTAVGPEVTDFSPGNLVFGGLWSGVQTEYLVVDEPSKVLHRVPAGLGIQTAGGLFITGRTAMAGIRALAIKPDETVYISGASGGVGLLAAQLAVNIGARVLGSASEPNHEFLRSIGVEPLDYKQNLEQALKDLAPEGISAAFSLQGVEEIEMLLRLGVAPARLNSVGAGGTVTQTHGVLNQGTAHAADGDLDWLAMAIAYGHIINPTASIFPVEQVQEAYRFLKEGHPIGKVLLRFPAQPLTQQQLSIL